MCKKYEEDDDEIYRLSLWGCLYSVLTDYGIECNHITGTIGEHMVQDFMKVLCEQGYVDEVNHEEGANE